MIDETTISFLYCGILERGRVRGNEEFQYCSISPTPGPWRELRSQCQLGEDGVEVWVAKLKRTNWVCYGLPCSCTCATTFGD